MGEPAVEVKTEDEPTLKKKESSDAADGAPDAKKVKLEPNSEEVPEASDAKKVKLEPNSEEVSEGTDSNGVVKKETDSNGVVVKMETGENTSNGLEEETAEERGIPGLEAEIVCQVEYYFGDVNLPRDKFLQEQIKLEDGWIPIDVLLRFQRLARLSKKPATIVTALKNSSTLIEVNDDGTKIRRSPSKPLPERTEEWQKQVNERTVYCKGFPQDQPWVGQYLEFFKTYGPVQNVNLRKYSERQTKKVMFKGSAYVLFETKELADKFLALESVKYNDKELIRMTFDAHVAEQKKERDERWGKKVKKDGKKEEQTQPKNKKEFAKGCVLKLTDLKNEELTREEIKSTLTDLGADVGYIDFSKGDTEALVRLRSLEDGAASQFIQKLGEGGEQVKFGEDEVKISVIEGEEEAAYLEKTRQSLERLHQKSNRGRKNHRGKFRGNKRGRSPATDGQ